MIRRIGFKWKGIDRQFGRGRCLGGYGGADQDAALVSREGGG